MKKVAGVVLLLSVLLVGGCVATTSVMLVDVEEAGGPNLVLPVPLPVARAGLAFAPDEALRVGAPELGEHLDRAERIVEALREAPDGLFVEVDDRGEHVTVRKDGDALRIRVLEGRGTTVKVNLPLGSVRAALEAYDEDAGAFDAGELLAALGEGGDGELVHVRDEGTEVAVRMW